MATERQRKINKIFLDAWEEFGDGTSTEFLLSITSDREDCDYEDVVDALAAVEKEGGENVAGN